MVDKDLLAKALDKMSDEELYQLVLKARDGKEPEVKEPEEKISVKLSDGTVVEAKDAEELNKLLMAKLEEYRQPEPAKEPTPAGPQKPEWDYDKFSKTFVKDPREGLDYMEMAEFGFPVRKAVPVLLATVAQMAKKLQEIEAQRFIDTHEEYEPSPENRRAIEGIMTERGWAPNYQTLSDAFDIAKARGLVKVKEKEKKTESAFIPPRVPSTGGGDTRGGETLEQLLAAAQDMPLEKLEQLLLAGGVLKSGGRG